MLKFLQRLALDFPYYLSVIFPRTFLQTDVEKILKIGPMSSSARNALSFFFQ